MNKRVFFSFLLIFNRAFTSSGGGACVNDNCKSSCDHGNTIFGPPGKVLECDWNDGKKWKEINKICADSRVKSATLPQGMQWVKEDGGSRQRCWRAACSGEGSYLRGDLTSKAVGNTCMPCVGSAAASFVVDNDGTQVVFKIIKRTDAPKASKTTPPAYYNG
jgi:hypothetical protein